MCSINAKEAIRNQAEAGPSILKESRIRKVFHLFYRFSSNNPPALVPLIILLVSFLNLPFQLSNQCQCQ